MSKIGIIINPNAKGRKSIEDRLKEIGKDVEKGFIYKRDLRVYEFVSHKDGSSQLIAEPVGGVMNRISDMIHQDQFAGLYEAREHFQKKLDKYDGNGILDISDRPDLLFATKEQAECFSRVEQSYTNLDLIANKIIKEGILKNDLLINIMDLGCGDGKKVIRLFKNLEKDLEICKYHIIKLNLYDSNKEMLKLAHKNLQEEKIYANFLKFDLRKINKYHFEIPEKIYEYNFENTGREIFLSLGQTLGDLLKPGGAYKIHFETLGRKIFLLLGQTLGNFDNPKKILRNISKNMNAGDYLMLEVNLRSKKTFKKYVDSGEFVKKRIENILKDNETINIETKIEIENFKIYVDAVLNEDYNAKLKKRHKIRVAKSDLFELKELLKILKHQKFIINDKLMAVNEEEGEFIGLFEKKPSILERYRAYNKKNDFYKLIEIMNSSADT